MIVHKETRELPYTTRQLFNLVAEVEKYPEFLPWVQALRVVSRRENELTAEMAVRFKLASASYTSLITLSPPEHENAECRIDVSQQQGPFKVLKNHWRFIPRASGDSEIQFEIEFAFESMLLQKLMGMMFEKAARKMVGVFEERAKQLYG